MTERRPSAEDETLPARVPDAVFFSSFGAVAGGGLRGHRADIHRSQLPVFSREIERPLARKVAKRKILEVDEFADETLARCSTRPCCSSYSQRLPKASESKLSAHVPPLQFPIGVLMLYVWKR